MQTVDRDLRAPRDRVDAVADRLARVRRCRRLTSRARSPQTAGSLELVVAKRKISFETTQHHLRQAAHNAPDPSCDHRCAAFLRLRSKASRSSRSSSPRRRPVPYSSASTVTHKCALYSPSALRGFAPHRFHVRSVDPLRQATVGRDLRTLHPAQRVDLPQYPGAPGNRRSPASCSASRTPSPWIENSHAPHVLRDHLGTDLLDPDPGALSLSHRPHRFSRDSVYATVCGLTPLARYSSI